MSAPVGTIPAHCENKRLTAARSGLSINPDLAEKRNHIFIPKSPPPASLLRVVQKTPVAETESLATKTQNLVDRYLKRHERLSEEALEVARKQLSPKASNAQQA